MESSRDRRLDSEAPTDEIDAREANRARRAAGIPADSTPEAGSQPRGAGGRRFWKIAALAVAAGAVVVAAAGILGRPDYTSLDRDYFTALGRAAIDSQAVGRNFQRDLARTALTRTGLVADVAALLRRQERAGAQLASLSPPPRLRTEYEHALLAFELRANGLAGFLEGLRDPRTPATVLAREGYRLITSDVLWLALVQAPTLAELDRERVKLRPPVSTFLASDDAVSADVLARDLARTSVSGAAASGSIGLGSTGPMVSAWQTELDRWLQMTHRSGSIDASGIFDAATQAATVAFQLATGIATDGVVGPVTRAAMVRALVGG
jgi:peptidoglycan hydrolase-like protein with peptidoglycan-binding domain